MSAHIAGTPEYDVILYPSQVKYAEDLMKEIYGEDSENAKGGSLLTCIAVTSLVGRLVCGKLADHPKVNRIFLQQERCSMKLCPTKWIQN